MSAETTYLNLYKPRGDVPPDCHATTPADKYDQNFVFPPKVLKSDRVEIRPFIPSLHAQLLADGVSAHPEVMEWLPYYFNTVENVRMNVEKIFRTQPSSMYHAIYSAPPGVTPVPPVDEWKFAGVIGMINASVKDATAEPGFIIIFPEYQRTHVLTHAAGLMIHRILDSEAEGGLNCRRCQWYTSDLNMKSQAAGQRLGFKFEGIMRAQRVIEKGWQGRRAGRPPLEQNQTRDSWVGSIMWEEWEGGVREKIDKMMARKE